MQPTRLILILFGGMVFVVGAHLKQSSGVGATARKNAQQRPGASLGTVRARVLSEPMLAASFAQYVLASQGGRHGVSAVSLFVIPQTVSGASWAHVSQNTTFALVGADPDAQSSEHAPLVATSGKAPEKKPTDPSALLSESALSRIEPVPVSPTISTKPLPPMRWPLALQELDLQAAGLSPAQVGTLDEIAAKFIDQIGGENQPANDPDYQKKWRAHQPTADQQFRTLWGQQAFLRAQLAGTQEATQPQTGP